jgi:uncharacterized DUF497 family protein
MAETGWKAGLSVRTLYVQWEAWVFDWDEDNIRHIAEHGVTQQEAEYALTNNPTDAIEQDHEGEVRFWQLGFTEANRCLIVVTTWRGEKLRVVTAYPAPRALFRKSFKRK